MASLNMMRPAVTSRGNTLRTSVRSTRASRRRATPLAAHASAAVDVARWALAAPTMYALVSANEYAAHRWYQHAEFNKDEKLQALYCKLFRVSEAPKVKGGGHVEHHAETYDDMSLKTAVSWTTSAPAAVLDKDPYRGTAFSYDTTRLMTGQMFATCTPVLLVMGFDPMQVAGLVLASTAVHGLVWNALHPAMHGLPDVPGVEGLPSSWMGALRTSAYFDYLYQNHEGHHVMGGKCNYNVCCPLMDHVLGTYVEESVWRPQAKLPEREEPRPKYVAGEYAANIELRNKRLEASSTAENELVTV